MGGACSQFNKNQTRQLLVFFLSLSFFGFSTTLYAKELVDRIIAIVDSQPILHSEVESKVKNGPLVLVASFPKTSKDSLFDQAVNDLINYRLILKAAEELDLEVTDEDIEAQVEKIMQMNHITKVQLAEFLKSQKKTLDDYKKDLKEQMLYMRFKGRILLPKVKITDKDIESFYVKTQGESADSTKLVLRQLLLQASAEETSELYLQKKKLADEAYLKLQNGTPFLEVEKIYSDLSDAREDKPPMEHSLRDLSPAIREALNGIEPGSFTNPVKTPQGFHIFYLVEKKFSLSGEFNAQKKKLENHLREAELLKQTEEWLFKARMKADIKFLPES